MDQVSIYKESRSSRCCTSLPPAVQYRLRSLPSWRSRPAVVSLSIDIEPGESIQDDAPVVHEDVRLPDAAGRDAQVADVAVVGRVPAQIVVVPVLGRWQKTRSSYWVLSRFVSFRCQRFPVASVCQTEKQTSSSAEIQYLPFVFFLQWTVNRQKIR